MKIDDRDFEQWVQDAIRFLPRKFADALDNIAIDVEPYPSVAVRRRIALGRGQMLLGLYTGVPLTERTHNYAAYGSVPDKITLYKRYIEMAAGTPEEVRREVAMTLLHEVGHYFGMTEDQLRDIELLDAPSDGPDEA